MSRRQNAYLVIKMKILNKEILAEVPETKIVKLEVLAPEIAAKARAGQFVVVMATEVGERIPLTIVEKDEQKESITLIFQELGLTSKILGKLSAGESLSALVGPLGNPTEIKNYGRVVIVGGGVGVAEIYPVAIALKKAGNHLTIIIGSRTKGLLILENELKAVADEFYVTTDDGSFGREGFTTDILQELLNRGKYDFVYAVGPIPMMHKVSLITKDFNLPTVVSLNALMVDATGMCGCCRVTVGNETKFSCVDGPEFAAQEIDWEELSKRNRIYDTKERHICKVYNLC